MKAINKTTKRLSIRNTTRQDINTMSNQIDEWNAYETIKQYPSIVSTTNRRLKPLQKAKRIKLSKKAIKCIKSTPQKTTFKVARQWNNVDDIKCTVTDLQDVVVMGKVIKSIASQKVELLTSCDIPRMIAIAGIKNKANNGSIIAQRIKDGFYKDAIMEDIIQEVACNLLVYADTYELEYVVQSRELIERRKIGNGNKSYYTNESITEYRNYYNMVFNDFETVVIKGKEKDKSIGRSKIFVSASNYIYRELERHETKALYIDVMVEDSESNQRMIYRNASLQAYDDIKDTDVYSAIMDTLKDCSKLHLQILDLQLQCYELQDIVKITGVSLQNVRTCLKDIQAILNFHKILNTKKEVPTTRYSNAYLKQ